MEAGHHLAEAPEIDPAGLSWLPPLSVPTKIICIGLNYVDHSLESGFTPPDYPTIFARFNSSLIGHEAAIRRPAVSAQLDAITWTGARAFAALEHDSNAIQRAVGNVDMKRRQQVAHRSSE